MKKRCAMILCVLILMSAALPAAAFEESQLSPITGLYPSVYIDQGLYYYRRPNSSMDGVINNRGEIIVADGQFPQITSQAHDFSTGQTVLYVTKRDPITSGLLYGIMDLQGNWVLPCKFTEITAFYDDLAFAKSYEGDDSTIQKSWIVGLDGRQVPLTSDYDRNMSRFGCGAAVLADGRPASWKREGCLFQLEQEAEVTPAEQESLSARFLCSNVSRADGVTRLRLIAARRPAAGAVPVRPNMEDLYLYHFEQPPSDSA